MPSISGARVATLHFEFLEGGVTRTAMVQLTARRTDDEFQDLTYEVGAILVEAIQQKTGYQLVTADLATETTERVYPPE